MLVDQKSLYKNITEEDYHSMAGPDWPDYHTFSQGGQIEKFVADEIDQMLSAVGDRRKQISNFCVLPFYGREFPSDTHCCLLPPVYNIDKIRTDMLHNRRPSECSKCWRVEDAGHLSDRQIKNRTLDFYTNIDLLNLYDNAVSGNYQTSHYKLAASNFCNATCVTCNSYSSTAWADLLEANSQSMQPLRVVKVDDQKISIDYQSAKFIGFMGGEPTMIRTHWDALEKLLEHDNRECMISFVTNGSFDLTARQKSLLKEFVNVNFNFSIDGTEKVFEYLRFPLNWQKLLDNINWAKEQNFLVSATYTISNLNILYHETTKKWFNNNDIKFIENPVYDPTWFAPRSLDRLTKEKLLEQTNDNLIRSLLRSHTADDDNNYRKFLSQIKSQDKMKGIRMNDYLPEFADLIDY